MRIFDNEDNEVPQGQDGEIVIRGPMVMKGYWNMPEATAEVIKNGYFYITDRKKTSSSKAARTFRHGSSEGSGHPCSHAQNPGRQDPQKRTAQDVMCFLLELRSAATEFFIKGV